MRSLAESPSFNLVLTITMLVLTAMLASFLLLCIVAMRRRMRHADADGSRDARHSKRARRKCALLFAYEAMHIKFLLLIGLLKLKSYS